MLFVFMWPTKSWANCKWNSEIIELQNQLLLSKNSFENFKISAQLDLERSKQAKQFFTYFIKNKTTEFMSDECLNKINQTKSFTQLVQSSFLQSSLEYLENNSNSQLKKLLKLVKSKYSGFNGIIFNIIGKEFNTVQNPTPFKAGFHRGRGSFFMDISRTNPEEWFVILVHELAHVVDEKMFQGVVGFSNEGPPKKLVAYAQQTDDPMQIPVNDLNEIKDWMEFGMDRNVLAEFRAWAVTYVIYNQETKNNNWKKIDWIEQDLKQKKPDQGYLDYSFQLTTGNVYQESFGVFEWPLAQNILQQLFSEIISGKRTLNSGNLKIFFEHNEN